MAVSSNNEPSGMFREPTTQRTFPWVAIAIASVAVLILVGVLVLLGHRKAPPATAARLHTDATYAKNLTISDIQMSEADSQLGGKSTYIDGHIVNHGTSTVTGILTQVVFANNDGQPPQTSATQMLLIRARQPYIDTEMLSTAPIAPGAAADFRLIFESVPEDWNTEPPVIHLTEISTR